MPLKYFGPPQNIVTIKQELKRTFLFFGAIREYKRLDLFIQAANVIGNGAHFVIAGSCKDWSIYESLIDINSNISCYIQFIDNDMIPDLFTQSDFLVLPYSDTTQSGLLLIAYKYSLPIIAINHSYFNDMVTNGENGFILNENTVDSLVSILDYCINMPEDKLNNIKSNQSEYSIKYMNHTDVVSTFTLFIDKYISCNANLKSLS